MSDDDKVLPFVQTLKPGTVVAEVGGLGDERLRGETFAVESVTDEVRTLARDLIDTMFSLNAAGIAAIQVGRFERMFIIGGTVATGEEDADPLVFINPEVVEVYFCDPQSPWQRGSNENTNRLLRQYFPKRQPVDGFSQRQLNAIARKLNGRPRKTLDFATPAEVLNVALTR